MSPSSLLTLIFFSVKILQELSELNVSISPPSTRSSFYHSFLSTSPIPSKLFPRIAMTISPSNPMTTSVFTWLVFSSAFDIMNSPSFPWLSLMPSFLHFSFPREVLPHSRCLNAWTKNLPPFPLYSCSPFFSLSFFILPCILDQMPSLWWEKERDSRSLPCLAWQKNNGLDINRKSTQGNNKCWKPPTLLVGM